MNSTKMSAPVERAIHDAMRITVKEIWDRHRICVLSAHFSWIDLGRVDGKDKILDSVNLDTTTYEP